MLILVILDLIFGEMILKKFFKKIDYINIKNYLLFSSNLNHVFTYQKLEKNILIQKKAGYFKEAYLKKF